MGGVIIDTMKMVGFPMKFLKVNITGNLKLCFHKSLQRGNREYLNMFPKQWKFQISYIFPTFFVDVYLI